MAVPNKKSSTVTFICCVCSLKLRMEMCAERIYTVCTHCGVRLVVEDLSGCRRMTSADFYQIPHNQMLRLTEAWLRVVGDAHGPSLGFDRHAPREPLAGDFLEFQTGRPDPFQTRLRERFQQRCRRYGQAEHSLAIPGSCSLQSFD